MQERNSTDIQIIPGNSQSQPTMNRRNRRAHLARQKRVSRAAKHVSERRLDNFKLLQAWKETDHGCTHEQTDSVFRVALAKLFKKDLPKDAFERQLSAIVCNVKDGHKYASDVPPEAPE